MAARTDKIARSASVQLTQQTQPGMIGVASGEFDIAQDQRRVKDVASARSIFNRFVQDNTQRSAVMTQTRGQLEGNRPFDPKLLEESGTAWQTNVNFGDAQANRDRALTPYWSRINDVPHKIAVTIDSTSPHSSVWEVAFAEAFDEFIADWNAGGSYLIQLMAMMKHMVDDGPGIVQWDDRDSPRFSAVNTQRIYFPKNARMDPDSWDVVALVKDTSPSELYLKIKDKASRKTSKDSGWNLAAVEAAIVYGMYGNSQRDARDMTRWQDDLVQNDITVASIFEPLQLVWMFVRQFDGKISARVFTRQGGVEEFLFETDDYAEKFQQFLGCIWYDTGVDSLIHSIKGFAIKNFHFNVLLNRMKSRMVDGATLSFGVNLQRTSESTPDESPPIENYGPITVFPPGLEQMNTLPQLKQGMDVIEALDQNRAENSSQYRQQEQKQIQESDTATQANILATMQGQTTEAAASVVLAQMGQIFAECVRRLRKAGSTDPDAKKFVQRLTDRGVDPKQIDKLDLRVTSGANSGLADPVVRLQKFQQLLQMMNAPGVNGRYILEQYLASMLGANGAAKAMLPEGANSNIEQRRQAQIENSLFGQGMMLQVDPNDAHFEHIQEHLTPLAPIVTQYKQSGQLPDGSHIAALVIGLEHTGQHVAMLKQDDTMKAQYQQVWPVFSQIQSVARGMLAEVQRQKLQQQQQQQQPPPANAQVPQGQPQGAPPGNPQVQGGAPGP